MVKLHNTLGRKKENFKPLKNKQVGFYSCGPTVYSFAHIGNLRNYIFNDILKRTLEYNSYKVNHVMNITDVGHLTSDADEGEDKMEKAAKKEKKTAKQIADFYTKAFKKDIKALNIMEPNIWAKATDHIREQIDVIKTLEKNGYTYRIKDGIYFDTSKVKDYGKLTGPKQRKLKAGARVKMAEGKKNITDFALWKFSDEKRQMEWNSPWGIGFPGWHTECVAMAMKYLGIPFDIHTGAIDLIPTHHTNEIAQAKAAFNKDLAKYWLHGEHLILKQGKMAKSEGNIILVDDLVEKGFNPLAFRYLCLTTHYRSKLTFSWESLKASQNALDNLYEKITLFNRPVKMRYYKERKEFLKYINDDLDTPKALALVWRLVKEGNADKELLIEFDKVLGLDLSKIKKQAIPKKIKDLAKKREKCREEKNFKIADQIRREIEKSGYSIEDTNRGPKIKGLLL
jgi:cysteinyl-tRNA synthetase